MNASKLSVLKPLIESSKGQHLTAYLVNDGNVLHLRRQLRETLDTAYEYLAPVQRPDMLVRFLAPIHNALEDENLLVNFKGNVGIFRNENSFRILSLPVSVEQSCVVATSFHVKPLLRWMQVDRDFLLLGVSDGCASLYQGSQSSFNLVDSVAFPSFVAKPEDATFWLNEWLENLTRDSRPPLFVVGRKELANYFMNKCRHENTRKVHGLTLFTQSTALETCAEIRSILKKDVKAELEQALVEFYHAEDLNLANKNIFQIAKAVIKGKVRKLIIADGINIFGKIDKKTGGLSIHPTHLDNEDDDILDDLAQQVLANGGEVIVASLDQIPKGRPILAILEGADGELTKQLQNKAIYEQEI